MQVGWGVFFCRVVDPSAPLNRLLPREGECFPKLTQQGSDRVRQLDVNQIKTSLLKECIGELASGSSEFNLGFASYKLQKPGELPSFLISEMGEIIAPSPKMHVKCFARFPARAITT